MTQTSPTTSPGEGATSPSRWRKRSQLRRTKSRAYEDSQPATISVELDEEALSSDEEITFSQSEDVGDEQPTADLKEEKIELHAKLMKANNEGKFDENSGKTPVESSESTCLTNNALAQSTKESRNDRKDDKLKLPVTLEAGVMTPTQRKRVGGAPLAAQRAGKEEADVKMSNSATLGVDTLLVPHSLARHTTKAEFLSGPKLSTTENPLVHVGEVKISEEDAERFKVGPLREELIQQLVRFKQLSQEISEKSSNSSTKEFCTLISKYSVEEVHHLDLVCDLASKTGIREGINGYRSLLRVMSNVAQYSEKQLRKCPLLSSNPSSYWNKWWNGQTEESWLERSKEVWRQPEVISYLFEMAVRFATKTVDLLVNHEQLAEREMDVFSEKSDIVSRHCFYGRDFCPQYSESIRKMLKVVMVANASYFFWKNSGFVTKRLAFRLPLSFFSGVYYGFLRPARTEEYISRNASFETKKLQGFWNLTEGVWNEVVTAVSIPVSLDVTLKLPPRQFKVERKDKQPLTVLPPYLPTEVAKTLKQEGQPFLNTSVRYISYFDHVLHPTLDSLIVRTNLERTFAAAHSRIFKRRETIDPSQRSNAAVYDRILENEADSKLNKLSEFLIIHFHGGGFVSQTAASHGLYLRQWARDTGVPIVSVNYRLAPDYPFPVALQECFYSYVWALENCTKLGSTAKKVIVVGDSAGGNFAAAVTIRAITERIRVPDSLIMCYPALYMLYVPSPSRILSIIDALLPQEALQNCFDAYLPKDANDMDPLQNPFLSPACSSDAILKKFPSDIRIMVGALDPLFDDSIWMAKRLTAVGKTVKMKVYENLNHGFLNFGAAPVWGSEMWDAVLLVSKWMNEVFREEEDTNKPAEE
eukprot:TRINITY_DN5475_c2_g2_i1.p1 TRINITY_DN5475_c2_g2~~TRINITY_DN5475_c2_g2_i1.p1  ORF type:complete len:871 (+),score=298.97 TRINITY_DN5475_c2_g2_i1:190-2802(+)